MKKYYYGILISALILGCATAKKINSISTGMTKVEVTSLMGKPNSVSGTGNIEYLNYNLSETRDDAIYGHYTNYYVRLVDGKVESYGRLGDFDSTKDPTININTDNKVETNSTETRTKTDKLYEELNKLKDLLDRGIITQEEFEKKKKEILEKY